MADAVLNKNKKEKERESIYYYVFLCYVSLCDETIFRRNRIDYVCICVCMY